VISRWARTAHGIPGEDALRNGRRVVRVTRRSSPARTPW
jgi:hypothetical protein